MDRENANMVRDQSAGALNSEPSANLPDEINLLDNLDVDELSKMPSLNLEFFNNGQQDDDQNGADENDVTPEYSAASLEALEELLTRRNQTEMPVEENIDQDQHDAPNNVLS